MADAQLALKATERLKQNVIALLKKNGSSVKDMVRALHLKDVSWWSHLQGDPDRGLPSKHYDRLADFLHVEVYQLFVPGIAGAPDRRSATDRRRQPERRVSTIKKQLRQLAASVQQFRAPVDHERNATEPMMLTPHERALIETARGMPPADYAAIVGSTLAVPKPSRKSKKRDSRRQSDTETVVKKITKGPKVG
jgi:hypothetical protein